MRLHGSEKSINAYEPHIKQLAAGAPSLSTLPAQFPMFFGRFEALYDIVRRARNDAMHIGAYARHATAVAVELCIGLEEAVMTRPTQLSKVSDLMVKTPVSVELWQPVAYARQLMLTHSFSFLPVFRDKWKLVSELAMVRFLRSVQERRTALTLSIEEAESQDLHLIPATTLKPSDDVSKVLSKKPTQRTPTLWLVVERNKQLVGVLSVRTHVGHARDHVS